MNFAEILKEESKWTKTTNGEWAKNTTDSALLDMFSQIGSMRNRSDQDKIKMFELAYQENPLLTLKCLFYARDIRGGLGERDTFRAIIRYMGDNHTDDVIKNISLIPEYGRYDDLYFLIGTKAEKAMWEFIRFQLIMDITAMDSNKPVSLLAKWLKKADASSKNTKMLGIYTAKKLNMSVYEYKRICNKLRKYINVVEIKMSNREWEDIEYSKVPSNAMTKYRTAFYNHDYDGITKYIEDVKSGKQKINSSTLYPYDIVEKVLYGREQNDILEQQWKNLPDYVGDVNALVMADVSGSMEGRPMATSIGLALYFAERNKGAYKNIFMTFSSRPEIVEIKGESLYQKIHFIENAAWGMNTNLTSAFQLLLHIAVKNKCKQEDLPKCLIIVSDMQIDAASGESRKLMTDRMKEEFKQYGYEMPRLVYWNVNSVSNTFLADKESENVFLVSGSSINSFKNVLDFEGTPYKSMLKVLNDERYNEVSVCSN